MFKWINNTGPFIRGHITRTIILDHNKGLIEVCNRREVRTLMTYEAKRVLAFVQTGEECTVRYRRMDEVDERFADVDEHGIVDGVITHIEGVVQDYDD